MEKLRIVALTILMSLAWLPSAFCQTVTGSIGGTVADPTGAVVAGAKVTLKNELTGQERQQDTGTSGDFVFTEIVPATYDVAVSKDGFKTYAQPGIVVATSERVDLHEITLEIGAVTQEVTVSAAAARVETDNGGRTGLITQEQMADIPNAGRNYLATLKVLPGITGTNTINGGQIGQALVQLDGIAFADNGVQGTGGNYNPNIEAIGEIKVLLNNYSAEYGARAGGQINVSAKSGTNQFHGSGYEFLKNEWFDARAYNFAPTPGVTPVKSRDRFNNPGYTIGGPIFIPGTSFDKSHNKLFFFWSQEWLPSSGGGAPSYVRLPTAAERAGNFAQDVGGCTLWSPSGGDPTCGSYPGNPTFVTLFCPQDTAHAQALSPAQAANIVTSCNTLYPTSGSFPIATSLQNYVNRDLPLPNYCAEGSATLALCNQNSANDDYITTSHTSHDQELVRFDWAIGPKTTFFVRGIRDYQLGTSTTDTKQTCASAVSSCPFPRLPGNNLTVSYGIVATLVHTFTANLVNDFTVGQNLNIQNFSPSTSAVATASRSALGIVDCAAATLSTCLPEFLPSSNTPVGSSVKLAPYVNGFGPTLPAGGNADQRYPFNGRQYGQNFTDNLSWVHGAHSFKFGTYIELGLRNARRESFFNGTYSFNSGNVSQDPNDTNYSVANALLGIITSAGYSESNKLLFSHGRYHDIDWYLQDDWKVTRRLTVNGGIRFQYITPTRSQGDQLTNFEVGLFNSVASSLNPLILPRCTTATSSGGSCPAKSLVGYNPVTQTNVPSALIGAYAPNAAQAYGNIYPGMKLFPAGASVINQPSIGYGPRIAFGYDAFGNGKTAIRGGFGVFYDRNIGDDFYLQLLQQPPNLLNYNVPVTTVSALQGFCASGCNINNLYLSPVNVQGAQEGYKMPQSYEWSFGVQHDLGRGFLLDLAYAANGGRHRPMTQEINAVNYGTLLANSPNFAGCVAYDPSADTGPGCSHVKVGTTPLVSGNYADILRPYPNMGQISFRTFDGSSNYNSLQAQLTRRFSKTLTFSGAWTYSKVLDYGGSWSPFIPRRRSYGPDGTYRKQNLVINWTFYLPAASKKWDNVFTREGLDGWQITGIETFTSGAPQTVGLGFSGPSQNLSGGLDSLAGAVSFSPTCQGRLLKHFAPSCIVAPPLTGATPGLGNASLRDVFTGPGINNWDTSLFKQFALGKNESRNVEIRLETYNTWNHTQFSQINTTANFTFGGTLGTSSAALTPNFESNTHFLQYTNAASARTMQLAVKIHF